MTEDDPSRPLAARSAPETKQDPDSPPSAAPPSATIRRGTRLLLSVAGALLVLVGLVGLALPIVPQTVPLALGIALLSLASDRIYGHLQTLLGRWPRAWRTIQALRRRLENWLSR